jgi:hypothetical protein
MASDDAVTGLLGALREAEALLRLHGHVAVSDRLLDLSRRLDAGDTDVIQTALSESTGSMGSLRDQYIYPENGDDHVAVNARLDAIVVRVRDCSRAAMASQ